MRYAEVDATGTVVSVVEVFRSDDAEGDEPTLEEVAVPALSRGRQLVAIPDDVDTFAPQDMRYEHGEFVPAPPADSIDVPA